jgi:hypothetical protein
VNANSTRFMSILSSRWVALTRSMSSDTNKILMIRPQSSGDHIILPKLKVQKNCLIFTS